MDYKEFADRIDIDAVYDELGWEPTSREHKEDKGYCLDLWGYHKHGDTTGKLAINRDKKVYNCWVCGGGTLLHLYKEAKGISEEEAEQQLYRFTTPQEFEINQVMETVDAILSPVDEKKNPLPYFNPAVLESYTPIVKHYKGRAYLLKRRISTSVARYFDLRMGPGDQIIFPHLWDGRLVGYQSRWPSGLPKYTNTDGFPRERTLWGYHFALKQAEAPIIVESVPTALYLISEGYSSIATFGAQVTDEQLKLLRVFQQGVQLAPDADPAGDLWLHKATEYLVRYVPVMHVPRVESGIIGSDLGDLDPEDLATYLCQITLA